MVVGAVIAGLLIVSLFLETLSSSPRSEQDTPPDAEKVP